MGKNRLPIHIGNLAGLCFRGKADVQIVHHCRQGLTFGHYYVRKKLRAAGWEYDRWFEWHQTRKEVRGEHN